MDGFTALNSRVQRLRQVRGLGEKCASLAASAIDAYLRKQIAAGQAPRGAPWKLTKKGEVAKLGSKMSVSAVGPAVLVTLRGKSFLHHTGRARGRITRTVIPKQQLPDELLQQIGDIMNEQCGGLLDG